MTAAFEKILIPFNGIETRVSNPDEGAASSGHQALDVRFQRCGFSKTGEVNSIGNHGNPIGIVSSSTSQSLLTLAFDPDLIGELAGISLRSPVAMGER